MSAVYQAAVDLVKSQKPAYLEKMSKSVGFVATIFSFTSIIIPRKVSM